MNWHQNSSPRPVLVDPEKVFNATMSRPNPKIVLLADMKDLKNTNFDLDILRDIQPTQIPREFIVRVDVTFSGGRVVEFDTSRINKNFTVEEIQDFLYEFDRGGLVRLIEITLDLEKIYGVIQTDCNKILSNQKPKD